MRSSLVLHSLWFTHTTLGTSFPTKVQGAPQLWAAWSCIQLALCTRVYWIRTVCWGSEGSWRTAHNRWNRTPQPPQRESTRESWPCSGSYCMPEISLLLLAILALFPSWVLWGRICQSGWVGSRQHGLDLPLSAVASWFNRDTKHKESCGSCLHMTICSQFRHLKGNTSCPHPVTRLKLCQEILCATFALEIHIIS